ncbi:hypothetical protein HYH03_013825 [Edaphochlamys debaryana]|uniref:Uncharacterized protein n=1 Tax=Edaphochlamys debaryana TaxID=47281 RepID=A0A835XPA0_9CHLO|nr:hypothetical protein HYH03_013825 [Edaphochlamys debaryana]|eukprot:KAG2487546.1 hypothetical protein HYH03_013825 [Edaphochlamys debaryana]
MRAAAPLQRQPAPRPLRCAWSCSLRAAYVSQLLVLPAAAEPAAARGSGRGRAAVLDASPTLETPSPSGGRATRLSSSAPSVAAELREGLTRRRLMEVQSASSLEEPSDSDADEGADSILVSTRAVALRVALHDSERHQAYLSGMQQQQRLQQASLLERGRGSAAGAWGGDRDSGEGTYRQNRQKQRQQQMHTREWWSGVAAGAGTSVLAAVLLLSRVTAAPASTLDPAAFSNPLSGLLLPDPMAATAALVEESKDPAVGPTAVFAFATPTPAPAPEPWDDGDEFAPPSHGASSPVRARIVSHYQDDSPTSPSAPTAAAPTAPVQSLLASLPSLHLPLPFTPYAGPSTSSSFSSYSSTAPSSVEVMPAASEASAAVEAVPLDALTDAPASQAPDVFLLRTNMPASMRRYALQQAAVALRAHGADRQGVELALGQDMGERFGGFWDCAVADWQERPAEGGEGGVRLLSIGDGCWLLSVGMII